MGSQKFNAYFFPRLEEYSAEFPGHVDPRIPRRAIKKMANLKAKLQGAISPGDIRKMIHSLSSDIHNLTQLVVMLLQLDPDQVEAKRLTEIISQLAEKNHQLTDILIRYNDCEK